MDLARGTYRVDEYHLLGGKNLKGYCLPLSGIWTTYSTGSCYSHPVEQLGQLILIKVFLTLRQGGVWAKSFAFVNCVLPDNSCREKGRFHGKNETYTVREVVWLLWRKLGVTIIVLFLLSACLHKPDEGHPVLSGSYCTQQPTVPVSSILVMTYNINYGRSMDGSLDLGATGKVLSTPELPDIIGLQEVDVRYARRSLVENQLSTLAEGLGMHYAYGPALSKLWNGYFGNAILSKYPIVEAYNNRLSKQFTDEDRAFLHVVVDVPDVGLLNVVVTHLGLNAKERTLHVQQILAYTRQLSGPVILLGDWNAEEEESIHLLEQHYTDAASQFERDYGTFPSSSAKGARIDRIYHSKQLLALDYQVLMEQASDHRPVVARFEFK